MNLPNFTPSPQRQSFLLPLWTFPSVGPAGTYSCDNIPNQELHIQTWVFFYTVNVALTASATTLLNSVDNINWLLALTLNNGLGTSRAAGAVTGNFGRYWKLVKTDAVGTLSQANLYLVIDG